MDFARRVNHWMEEFVEYETKRSRDPTNPKWYFKKADVLKRLGRPHWAMHSILEGVQHASNAHTADAARREIQVLKEMVLETARLSGGVSVAAVQHQQCGRLMLFDVPLGISVEDICRSLRRLPSCRDPSLWEVLPGGWPGFSSPALDAHYGHADYQVAFKNFADAETFEKDRQFQITNASGAVVEPSPRRCLLGECLTSVMMLRSVQRLTQCRDVPADVFSMHVSLDDGMLGLLSGYVRVSPTTSAHCFTLRDDLCVASVVNSYASGEPHFSSFSSMQLRRQQDDGGAAKMGTNLPPQSPSAMQKHKALGNAAYEKKRYQDAAAHYTRGIAVDPTSDAAAPLYSNRAAAFVSLKDFQKALSDAKMCIRLRPDWVKGHFRKGMALCGLKQLSDAERALKDALQCDPRNVEVIKCLDDLWQRGVGSGFVKVQEQNVSHEAALEGKRKSSASCPSGDEYRVLDDRFVKAVAAKGRGDKHLAAGELLEAELAYTEAISFDPNSESAAVYYASRAAVGLKTNVLFALRDAIVSTCLNPQYAKGYYRQGEALFLQGFLHDAQRAFQEALARDPVGHADVKFRLVTIKKALRNWPQVDPLCVRGPVVDGDAVLHCYVDGDMTSTESIALLQRLGEAVYTVEGIYFGVSISERSALYVFKQQHVANRAAARAREIADEVSAGISGGCKIHVVYCRVFDSLLIELIQQEQKRRQSLFVPLTDDVNLVSTAKSWFARVATRLNQYVRVGALFEPPSLEHLVNVAVVCGYVLRIYIPALQKYLYTLRADLAVGNVAEWIRERRAVASRHFSNKEYRLARLEFDSAAVLSPLSTESAAQYSNISACLVNETDHKIKYAEAFKSAVLCCHLRPDWAKGYYRKGVALEKLELTQEALAAFQEALRLDPSDAGIQAKVQALTVQIAERRASAGNASAKQPAEVAPRSPAAAESFSYTAPSRGMSSTNSLSKFDDATKDKSSGDAVDVLIDILRRVVADQKPHAGAAAGGPYSPAVGATIQVRRSVLGNELKKLRPHDTLSEVVDRGVSLGKLAVGGSGGTAWVALVETSSVNVASRGVGKPPPPVDVNGSDAAAYDWASDDDNEDRDTLHAVYMADVTPTLQHAAIVKNALIAQCKLPTKGQAIRVVKLSSGDLVITSDEKSVIDNVVSDSKPFSLEGYHIGSLTACRAEFAALIGSIRCVQKQTGAAKVTRASVGEAFKRVMPSTRLAEVWPKALRTGLVEVGEFRGDRAPWITLAGAWYHLNVAPALKHVASVGAATPSIPIGEQAPRQNHSVSLLSPETIEEGQGEGKEVGEDDATASGFELQLEGLLQDTPASAFKLWLAQSCGEGDADSPAWSPNDDGDEPSPSSGADDEKSPFGHMSTFKACVTLD